MEAGTRNKEGQRARTTYTLLGRAPHLVQGAAKDAGKCSLYLGWPRAQLKTKGSSTGGQRAASSPQRSVGSKAHSSSIMRIKRLKVMACNTDLLGENEPKKTHKSTGIADRNGRGGKKHRDKMSHNSLKKSNVPHLDTTIDVFFN